MGMSERATGSSPLRVLVRADASVEIGAGHVVRCATLANELIARGAKVTFACRQLPGDLNDWLRAKGFSVLAWQADDPAETQTLCMQLGQLGFSGSNPFDWLAVDHYGLSAGWETQMRSVARRVLVLDDLANRPHDCELLIDTGDLTRNTGRYQALTAPGCRLLLGPQYALLRSDFARFRERMRVSRSQSVSRVLIFFGGSDPTGETLKAIAALRDWAPLFRVDVVVGAANPRREEIQAECAALPGFDFHCQVEDMAERMVLADLAIGAGGTATWERLCLGLPAIVIAVADNQLEISRQVCEAGAQVFLGASGSVSENDLREAILALANAPGRRAAMSDSAVRMVDGLGAQRVAKIILNWPG